MSDRAVAELKAFAWPAYCVAVLLVVTPLVDLVANVWPPRLSAVEWRFGTFGLLSGFLLTPLLGMVLATAAAALLEHRGGGDAIARLAPDAGQHRSRHPARHRHRVGQIHRQALRRDDRTRLAGWSRVAGVAAVRAGPLAPTRPDVSLGRLTRAHAFTGEAPGHRGVRDDHRGRPGLPARNP
jgi:hypothetical protein